MHIEKTFRVCFDEEDRRALMRVRSIFKELANFENDVSEELNFLCECEDIQDDIETLLNL